MWSKRCPIIVRVRFEEQKKKKKGVHVQEKKKERKGKERKEDLTIKVGTTKT